MIGTAGKEVVSTSGALSSACDALFTTLDITNKCILLGRFETVDDRTEEAQKLMCMIDDQKAS